MSGQVSISNENWWFNLWNVISLVLNLNNVVLKDGDESKGQWRFNSPTPPIWTTLLHSHHIAGNINSNRRKIMDIIKPVAMHCLFFPLIKRSFLVDEISCQRSNIKTSQWPLLTIVVKVVFLALGICSM